MYPTEQLDKDKEPWHQGTILIVGAYFPEMVQLLRPMMRVLKGVRFIVLDHVYSGDGIDRLIKKFRKEELDMELSQNPDIQWIYIHKDPDNRYLIQDLIDWYHPIAVIHDQKDKKLIRWMYAETEYIEEIDEARFLMNEDPGIDRIHTTLKRDPNDNSLLILDGGKRKRQVRGEHNLQVNPRPRVKEVVQNQFGPLNVGILEDDDEEQDQEIENVQRTEDVQGIENVQRIENDQETKSIQKPEEGQGIDKN